MKTKTTLLAWALIVASIIGIVLISGCLDEKTVETPKPEATPVKEEVYKTVTDMRGKEVRIPKDPESVVTVSDGLVESTLIIFGVEDRLVGLGSSCVGMDYTYNYTTYSGENFTYTGGANPALLLYPKIGELPLAMRSGVGMNYETLASLNPDVVIMRLGSCSIQCYYETEENVKKTIERIESLGIPLVVLRAPLCHDNPDISTMYIEIELLGEVFNRQEKARELVDYLNKEVQFIKERTRDIKDEEKTKVLFFGLSKVARDKGGAGSVKGVDQTESVLLEDIVNAKNAYRGIGGHQNIISAEQVLTLNPDVILLPTSYGYHPPRELSEGEPFRNLQELRAIKEKRVYSLPWSPCNCARRLECIIDLRIIAKAAYPDRFSDVIVSDWVLDYYKNVYGVDDETAKKLRSAQWLDWMVEEGF